MKTLSYSTDKEITAETAIRVIQEVLSDVGNPTNLDEASNLIGYIAGIADLACYLLGGETND